MVDGFQHCILCWHGCQSLLITAVINQDIVNLYSVEDVIGLADLDV